MDYLQYIKTKEVIIMTKELLNLIINGLPSIPPPRLCPTK